MAKYVQFITYKGKRMLHTNAAGLEEEELLVALEEMKEALLKEGAKTLALTDVTGVKMSSTFVDKAKEVNAAIEKTPGWGRPSAVVGLTGLQKAVAQLFGRGVFYAKTIEEAKEWLVKEADKGR
jgi:hypothetical protein